MLPSGFNPTQTRAFQPTGVGDFQDIHDMKWATRTLVAGVIPAVTNFFSAAPSADATVDRYEQGNALVSSGQQYTIFGLFFQIYAGAAALLSDLEKVVNWCNLRLWTSSKEFGQYPISMVPAGGGLYVQGGNIAVTPTGAPGGQSVTAALNGMPGRNASLTLANPLIIQANQNIYAELIGPVTTPQTLTGAVICRVIFDGVLSRVKS
jgi:hypothetical protein